MTAVISLNLKCQEKLSTWKIVGLFILMLIVNLAIGFGICAGCTYLACMFFGFNWSIDFAAGCFFIMVMIWWFVTNGRS